jgi:peptidoglycan/LPS O-acetylase OafA/YrhL
MESEREVRARLEHTGMDGGRASIAVKHVDSLTGLRAVGALLVVAYHFYKERAGIQQPLLQVGGYLGVALFFSLSGYILCHVYAGLAEGGTLTQWRSFFIRRIARLWPLHAFMILVVVVLLPSARETPASDYVAHLTMTHAWWSNRLSLVGASWSISVEFFCYLLFPALLLWLRRGHWALAVFVVFGAAHVVVSLLDPDDWRIAEIASHRVLVYGPYFVFGICTFMMLQRYSWLRAALEHDAAFVFLAFGVLAAAYSPGLMLAIACAFALPLLVCAAHRSRYAGVVLGNPAMVFLGEISYAVYLSHAPLREACKLYLPGVPSVPLILLFSAGCFYLVERPARAWIRRFEMPDTSSIAGAPVRAEQAAAERPA